jgi:uncharacterized protein (TIGR02145 family)
MENKRKIQIYLLIAFGFVLISAISCQKENNDPVIKKEPIITWTNPDDILVYTSLSSIQLNAKSDVPGTFVYTPSIGEVMSDVAIKELKVDFTPDDSLTYHSTSKTVKINVVAGSLFNAKLTYGTMTDQDGNVYKTITIGTQTWMAENLKTTKYNDGTDIPNIDGTEWESTNKPAFWWFENKAANKDIYGALYNWHTVNTGKLAPLGWHIPSDKEWTLLENYLISNGFNYDGTTTGDRTNNNKIGKALASTTSWEPDNHEGTVGTVGYLTQCNSTGFSARPCGYTPPKPPYGVVYSVIPYKDGIWWCSTESSIDSSCTRYVSYNNVFIGKANEIKNYGLSIRCIKD